MPRVVIARHDEKLCHVEIWIRCLRLPRKAFGSVAPSDRASPASSYLSWGSGD